MKKLYTLLVSLALIVPSTSFSAELVGETKIGKGIEDRMITDETTSFALGEIAYLWLRVQDATGETVTVTWTNGDQTYPVTLNIGGSPWRTWSSKTLHIAGDWTVAVTDAAGTTLDEKTINVGDSMGTIQEESTMEDDSTMNNQ